MSNSLELDCYIGALMHSILENQQHSRTKFSVMYYVSQFMICKIAVL